MKREAIKKIGFFPKFQICFQNNNFGPKKTKLFEKSMDSHA